MAKTKFIVQLPPNAPTKITVWRKGKLIERPCEVRGNEVFFISMDADKVTIVSTNNPRQKYGYNNSNEDLEWEVVDNSEEQECLPPATAYDFLKPNI